MQCFIPCLAVASGRRNDEKVLHEASKYCENNGTTLSSDIYPFRLSLEPLDRQCGNDIERCQQWSRRARTERKDWRFSVNRYRYTWQCLSAVPRVVNVVQRRPPISWYQCWDQ